MENKQEQNIGKKVSGFGQDGYFLEDFDCSTVITVRVHRPEKSCSVFALTIWRSCLPTSCVHAAEWLHFPQEAGREPHEDKTSMKQQEESDKAN